MLALLLTQTVAANPITSQQAMQNALSFLGNKGISNNRSTLRLATPSLTEAKATSAYYVFNIGNNEGFVIAAGDDSAPAVLGYAEDGAVDMDNLPNNMKVWLEEYARQIEYIQNYGGTKKSGRTLTSFPAIEPLLTSKWGQSYPYNLNCPSYFGQEQCVTGCVCTAVAQILYYYRERSVSQTTGRIPGYTCSTKRITDTDTLYITVDDIPAGATIDWDNMLDDYRMGPSTDIQKQAVANLMKYCGAAIRIDYGNSVTGSSGIPSYIPLALRAFFNYSNDIEYKHRSNFPDDNDWENLIYTELSNYRPVFYDGSKEGVGGHAFVCDGYDGNGFFHINWGWNGDNDGYFLLSVIDSSQGSGEPLSGFTLYQSALINVEPSSTMPTGTGIAFNDGRVKVICVQHWDANGDGELSELEAALVTDLGDAFKQQYSISSFDELEYFTGLEEIGNSAFYHCANLTSITIPQNVKRINYQAFGLCLKLPSINIPPGVTSIGDWAFSDCRCLSSFTIPSGVTSLGMQAFRGCIGLTSISIPSSVTEIKDHAFLECSGLESITVDANNPVYNSQGDCNAIIETASNRLILGCKNTVIPATVTCIGDCAFNNCINLASINIPSSVTSIDDMAFLGCTSLPTITIPSSVTTIGNSVFHGCSSLTSIHIPSSVTSIGNHLFMSCDNLRSITVDANNTVYDSRDNCNAIIKTKWNQLVEGCNTTVIPNTVIYIGQYAFSHRAIAGELKIPNSVTSIGKEAFYQCSRLTSVTMGNSVSGIGNYSFYECAGLKVITLPASLEYINSYAFSSCDSIKKVICYASEPPSANTNCFESTAYENAVLLVPEAALGSYQAHATWGSFRNILSIEDNLPTGDVNGDGLVNISDIIDFINFLLNDDASGFDLDNADVDNNGLVNVSDVIHLINVLLNNV